MEFRCDGTPHCAPNYEDEEDCPEGKEASHANNTVTFGSNNKSENNSHNFDFNIPCSMLSCSSFA